MTGTGDGRRAALTLGPLLFNWSAAQRRDFYARIADEAPIDSVCLGEVVCAKRAPFSDPDLPEIARRLVDGGKEVIYSTLALVMDDHDRALVAEIANASDMLVEANDLGAIEILAGRTHVIGPFVNVYNEGALAWFAQRGARRVSLPVELPTAAIGALGPRAGAVELEVTAFGRLPLAISARCYHARARGLHKDGCRYVCDEDPDGLSVETLDGQGFLAVNGLQTLSHGVAALTAEIAHASRCRHRQVPALAAGGRHGSGRTGLPGPSRRPAGARRGRRPARRAGPLCPNHRRLCQRFKVALLAWDAGVGRLAVLD